MLYKCKYVIVCSLCLLVEVLCISTLCFHFDVFQIANFLQWFWLPNLHYFSIFPSSHDSLWLTQCLLSNILSTVLFLQVSSRIVHNQFACGTLLKKYMTPVYLIAHELHICWRKGLEYHWYCYFFNWLIIRCNHAIQLGVTVWVYCLGSGLVSGGKRVIVEKAFHL